MRRVPATAEVGSSIPDWAEGLQLMVEGEQTRFWIAPSLAFGDSPAHGQPLGTQVFDIELLSID